MSLLGEFVRVELLLQARSLRARGAVAVYLAAASVPAIFAARAQQGELLLGASSYVADVMTFLPVLSAALAAALSIDGILRDRRSGAWSVLTLIPMSSAGYLLRRWAALLVLLLPLSALPLGVAIAIAHAQGAAAGPLTNTLVPWLMRVAPVVIGVSAAALGAGTLADGIVPAAILLVTLSALLPPVLNKALAPSRRHASLEVADWLGTVTVQQRILFYRIGLRPERFAGLRAVIPATESPLQLRAYAGATAALAALPFAACLALLGVSAAFVRRTAPDLPPWRLRTDHSLRTLLSFGARLRHRLARDPRPERPDRLLLAAALGVVVLAFSSYWLRDRHYRGIMEATHRLQIAGWPEPTPLAIVPERARLEARLDSGGRAEATSELVLHNGGARPLGHLSFTLLDTMELAELAPSSGDARSDRRLDRLAVELEPPLAPGETRTLRAVTRGRPARIELSLRGHGGPFERRYRFQAHTSVADLRDLSLSYTVDAATADRVDLGWQDLAPLPRYAPWTLALAPGLDGGGLDLLPGETAAPHTALAVEIHAPARLLLGEACGASGRGDIRGSCLLPLRDWALAGGHLEIVPGLPVVFGVLPQHRAAAERLAEELVALPELVRRSWPSRAAPPLPVLIELAPSWAGDPRWGIASWSTYEERQSPAAGAISSGNLVRVPEAWLVRDRRLPAADLAASSVVSALLGQRLLAPKDQAAIEGLVREVVLSRLGRSAPGGAAIASRRLALPGYRVSLREPREENESAWDARLIAVTHELVARAGPAAVERGLERFFSGGERAGGNQASGSATGRDGASGSATGGDVAKPSEGDVAELLATIGEEAGVDLSRLERDGFEDGALPELALADVRSESQGGAYRVSGRVVNSGTGEAHCPVTVTSAAGSVDARVVVPPGGSATFAIITTSEPQTLLLDPDSTCLRWKPDPPGVLLQKVDLESGPGSGR